MTQQEKIALRLSEAREAAQKTQSDAAKFLGVTYQAVSNWERGTNPPLQKYRPQLAALYGVTVDEISAAFTNQ